MINLYDPTEYYKWYAQRPWVSVGDELPEKALQQSKYRVLLKDGREIWSYYLSKIKTWNCEILNPKMKVTHFKKHAIIA